MAADNDHKGIRFQANKTLKLWTFARRDTRKRHKPHPHQWTRPTGTRVCGHVMLKGLTVMLYGHPHIVNMPYGIHITHGCRLSKDYQFLSLAVVNACNSAPWVWTAVVLIVFTRIPRMCSI